MVELITNIIADCDNSLVVGAMFNLFGYAAGVNKETWDGLKAKYRDEPAKAEEWGQANAQMLKGLYVQEILDRIKEIPYADGAQKFFGDLDPAVTCTGILSSTIDVMADRIARELDIGFCVANELEVDNGIITGGYKLIVSMFDKLEVFARLMLDQDLRFRNTLYIGDNHNDLDIARMMSNNGGHAAAFNPYKCPELEEVCQITFRDYADLGQYIKRVNDEARAKKSSTSEKAQSW